MNSKPRKGICQPDHAAGTEGDCVVAIKAETFCTIRHVGAKHWAVRNESLQGAADSVSWLQGLHGSPVPSTDPLGGASRVTGRGEHPEPCVRSGAGGPETPTGRPLVGSMMRRNVL